MEAKIFGLFIQQIIITTLRKVPFKHENMAGLAYLLMIKCNTDYFSPDSKSVECTKEIQLVIFFFIAVLLLSDISLDAYRNS